MEESMGAVLGANVMRDHNVVFDFENHRVGFAEGVCDYRADVDEAQPGGEDKASRGKRPCSRGLGTPSPCWCLAVGRCVRCGLRWWCVMTEGLAPVRV